MQAARESSMNSVTFSEIERVRKRPGFLQRIDTWRQSLPWALTLLAGLPLLILALHLIDPGTPMPFIVVPAMVGGLLPICMLGPGRFEMRSRVDACQMIDRLDEALGALGYRRTNVTSVHALGCADRKARSMSRCASMCWRSSGRWGACGCCSIG
jgi:hypothetical protein